MFPENYISKFWSKVDICNEDDCWEWKSCKDTDGYGMYTISTKNVYKRFKSHRVAYELAYGEFDISLCICHACDNPGCVNPKHLWLGTNKENTQDKINKGRLKWGTSPGEKNGRAILDEYSVENILFDYFMLKIKPKEIAEKYNVKRHVIYHITNGINWKPIYKSFMESIKI